MLVTEDRKIMQIMKKITAAATEMIDILFMFFWLFSFGAHFSNVDIITIIIAPNIGIPR